MGKLSLVIADSDTDYLTKFERFLMVSYPQRFNVYSFASPDKLSDFLRSPDKKDILLINVNLYERELLLANTEIVILLTGDGVKSIPDGLETVAKYQHAEKLVTEILRIYSEKSLKACRISGNAGTRIVCFFSPAGGAGKTSIAVGCSIMCARRGMKVFYLNLENIPSTGLFFNSESEQSFSNVIYHLKGKENNLGLKLEGAKCCDLKTGVHFFAPPDRVLEMEELTGREIDRLVNEFRTNALYDAVFIDMSSGLNQRNIAVLNSADIIVTVISQDDISLAKMKQLKASVGTLKHKYGFDLEDKIIKVVNRKKSGESRIVTSVAAGEGHVVEIGECLSPGLNKLLESIFPKYSVKALSFDRGEAIV